jgi:hypothetical protein
MKKNHTDITIVLDRSGSMSSVAEDTIGGFNRFLNDQKKAPGTADITLYRFDHEFETAIDAKDVRTAPELTSETFVPRGNTALLDAIGRAVVQTGKRIGDLKPEDRPEKVVFVIITDGHENASTEYTRARIMEMIQHQESKYAWDFVFLGANQDAINTGAGIGIGALKAMTYASNKAGTDAAFATLASNMTSMRSGGKKDMSYTEEDRKKQKEAGAK